MKKERIDLGIKDKRVTFTAVYGEVCEKRPAVIVLPGGGYSICAPMEGEPVAERFADMGYAAFTLRYSVRGSEGLSPHTLFPEPLRQVAAAVKYVRDHAERYAAGSVVLLGFSAGGHLAANYCNLWNTPEVYGDLAEPMYIRPDVCVLGYAATELYAGSMLLPAIYGDRDACSDAELRRYSAKYHVGSQTPPTFLFHSVTDPMVPSRQSLELFEALEAAGVPCELHLFGCGGHAWALGEGQPAGAWPGLADGFIKKYLSSPLSFDKEHAREELRARFHMPERD